MTVTALRQTLFEKARSFGATPLLSLPDGTVATLADGYIPLLVNFSFEDKAAKGLRKLSEQAELIPAEYFSAVEMVAEHSALLLAGETGSGKTTFARHLALKISDDSWEPTPLARNEHGTIHDEVWPLENVLPLHVPVLAGKTFADTLEAAQPGISKVIASDAWRDAKATLLLMLDGMEALGANGPALLSEALVLQARIPRIRLLALGEISVLKSWALPLPFVRYDLLPLLQKQRSDAAKRIANVDLTDTGIALGEAAANPAQFVMALSAGDAGNTAETITDRWLAKIAGEKQAETFLSGLAFDVLSGTLDDPDILPITRVRQLLAARHLASQVVDVVVAHFLENPALWTPVVKSLAARLTMAGRADGLMEALLDGSGDGLLRGALLAGDLLTGNNALRSRVTHHLLAMIETGALTAPERERAGRLLSRFGDPRDLQALAYVPGGRFIIGSNSHPNSAPPHPVTVNEFRIALYPTTNAAYAAFIKDTGRLWRSPDGFSDERRNAPATNLTWHDAIAYCAWLTGRWQQQGRIANDEVVRLPTEPEWERAARGDQADAGDHTIVYPWGTEWMDDASNCEEAGFNDTCAVGLFPKGRSPYGCYDMAGQVWEWATTLWGENMATPSFPYPYQDDGRKALDAAPAIRRVLRGGCFSSGKLKACCTYRGSLEPDGFWRGNGFRIVVSRAQ
ncbi:SUMF1/EgtB/PvdO family nonheme iron enzyme [Rhizobium sp.]|uniref:SUMF1/EgtB/PvdO family nonheme iron enzyme n=1 Tax=Rhizobium sp. TaxID=391 RepID=UPI002AA887AF